MSGLLGDRDGRLLEMIRRRWPGRCEAVVRSARCCVTTFGVADRLAKGQQVVRFPRIVL